MKTQHTIAAIGISIALSFIGGLLYAKAEYVSVDQLYSRAETDLRDTLTKRGLDWEHRAEAAEAQLANANQSMATLEAIKQMYEAKFKTTTLLVEQRSAAAGPSLPLLGGAISLSINALQGQPGGMRAAWAIPAEVQPISSIPGAQYVWIDNATGQIKGTFLARPAETNP